MSNIIFDKDSTFKLDIVDSKDLVLKIKKGIKVNVVLNYISKVNNVFIDAGEGAILNLSLLSINELSSSSLKINLSENSLINVYFADFSDGKSKNNVLINQNGEHIKSSFHLASLTSNDDDKVFNVSLEHNYPNCFGEVICFGVCKDNSKLIFEGDSHIKNGCVKTSTNQKAKIMTFDKNSRGIARPCLKIDECDISANHAAAVGKIPDETMFYLMSRGLKEETAKELITMGYLRPILKGFESEELTSDILKAIERKM